MGERGDSITINGSDADFEHTCTPCGEDIRVKAVKYCPVCQKNLCATCTRHHGRQKITRSHTLQDCDASIKVSSITMTTKCRYHSDLELEMYCEEDDMVYCAKCIAIEHRSCRGVCSLENVKVSLNMQKEIERLKFDTRNMQMSLDETEKKTQINTDNIKEQKRDVVSKIEEKERQFIEHIRKLKQEALETLETEYSVVKENLETHISQVRIVKEEIESEYHQLQAFDNLDKRQQFVQTKLIQHSVNHALKIIEQIETNGYKDLHFTENKDLNESIMTSTSFGSIHNVTVCKCQLSSKLYKISSWKEINVKMKNEKNDCYISDICQLPDGTIMLADYNNCRIKRLDKNYNIKDCFNVGNFTLGICCTGDNSIAVKLCNKVLFISVASYLIKVGDIPIKNWHCSGIAYCDGELWVPTGSGVDVYSMYGLLLRTISKGVNGQNIFEISPAQMVVSGDSVFVTDNSDGAICLRKDHMVIGDLRDERLITTKSICVINDETVLIAGYNSHNIVMFDRNGKCLGELIDKESGLQNPVSMFYDKIKKCVIVGLLNTEALVVLDMSN